MFHQPPEHPPTTDRAWMRATVFQGKAENQGRPIVISVDTLEAAMSEPYSQDMPKDMAPLWAPVTYANNLRRDANVTSISALVIDVDNQCEHHLAPDDVAEALSAENITFCMHSTKSSTQSHPKFRVIVWIDRDITDMSEHRRAMVGLFDLLGRPSGVDLSCWNSGRIYYMPHAGQHYMHHAHRGEPASVDTLTWSVRDDDPLLQRVPTSAPHSVENQKPGRNNALKAQAFAGLCKKKPLDQIAAEVLDYDRRHHSPPLFEDPSEPYFAKAQNPEAAATAFVRSIARTFEHRVAMGQVELKTAQSASPGVSEAHLDITIRNDTDFRRELALPEYVVDGMFARSYLYAVTGHAGTGKTAMALTLAYAVARGDAFMNRQTDRKRVLYLAGENPDDLRKRSAGMRMYLDLEEDIQIDYIPQSVPMAEAVDQIVMTVNTHCQNKGIEYGLVIVDTDVAYYGGSDENDNVERRYHAQCLRRLIDITGKPAVVTLCHPSKGATADTMEPRGGGAFLGEIDCAITMLGSRERVEMEPHMRKFRGEPFDKVAFCIETVELPQYINKLTGKPMTTAIARYLPPKEEEAIEEMIGERQFKVLKHIHQHPDASMRGRILDFEAGFGGNVMKISAATLSRDIAQLKEMEYIKKAVRGFELTRRGKAAVEPKGEIP